jgi:YVTN family beta-propeller protein
MTLPSGSTAYVVSSIAGTVTPLAGASGRLGSPISVGLYSYPTGLAVSGSTAVVLDTYAGQVSLINTGTGHVFAPITVGNFPVAVAISG